MFLDKCLEMSASAVCEKRWSEDFRLTASCWGVGEQQPNSVSS